MKIVKLKFGNFLVRVPDLPDCLKVVPDFPDFSKAKTAKEVDEMYAAWRKDTIIRCVVYSIIMISIAIAQIAIAMSRNSG